MTTAITLLLMKKTKVEEVTSAKSFLQLRIAQAVADNRVAKGCGSEGSRQGHAETEERDRGDIDGPKGDGGMMRRTMLEEKMVVVKAMRMKMKLMIITMTMK